MREGIRAGVTITPIGGSFRTRIGGRSWVSSSSSSVESFELRRLTGLGGGAATWGAPSENLIASDFTVADPIETDFRGDSVTFLGEAPLHCFPDPLDETLSASVLTVKLVNDRESKSVKRKPLA